MGPQWRTVALFADSSGSLKAQGCGSSVWDTVLSTVWGTVPENVCPGYSVRLAQHLPPRGRRSGTEDGQAEGHSPQTCSAGTAALRALRKERPLISVVLSFKFKCSRFLLEK